MNSTSFLISQVDPTDIEEHYYMYNSRVYMYIEGVNILTGSCDYR